MNPYLKNLKKIEFVVTYACTGRCKHCSQGEHSLSGEHIDEKIATEAVKIIAENYNVETVMTFGGEPLLYTDTVCAIIGTACDVGIPHRQIITNGFASRDEEKIDRIVNSLAECGVNDLLLSVDAFHQETIPLDTVKLFADKAISCGIPVRLQPAWLISPDHNNSYNRITHEILDNIGINCNDGNVIFPEGNAKIFLSEYFTDEIPQNPYLENPYDIRCISFSPNGDVLNGNVYQQSITEILKDYKP